MPSRAAAAGLPATRDRRPQAVRAVRVRAGLGRRHERVASGDADRCRFRASSLALVADSAEIMWTSA